MKTRQEVDGYKCDECGTFKTYMTSCTGGCGKDYCYACRDRNLTHYHYCAHVSGCSNGDFCVECHERLQGSPLMNAYQKIATLRKEAEDWNEDWRRRTKQAEDELQRVIEIASSH